MAETADEAYQARLAACVGATGPATPAPYAVNDAMIGMWADALLDDNPVYLDADAARATGRPGVIAPPTMIQAWIMPKLSRMARGSRGVPGYAPYQRGAQIGAAMTKDAAGGLYGVLAERGYDNSLATNSRQTYHRELAPGDHVVCVSTIDAVSGLKHTAMGAGHFVTTRMEYFDQDRRPVATQLWTVLRFRTPTAAELAEATARRAGAAGAAAPPPKGADDAPAGPLIGAPRPGMRTATTVIPITPSFVVATSLATHDFYAIHHDVDWARSIGRPGIFTNILTTTGLVGGVMTGWGGPATRLRATDLRLFAPNYPGDELTLTGVVTAVEGEDVTMKVTGLNGLGAHVQAVVTATVPGR